MSSHKSMIVLSIYLSSSVSLGILLEHACIDACVSIMYGICRVAWWRETFFVYKRMKPCWYWVIHISGACMMLKCVLLKLIAHVTIHCLVLFSITVLGMPWASSSKPWSNESVKFGQALEHDCWVLFVWLLDHLDDLNEWRVNLVKHLDMDLVSVKKAILYKSILVSTNSSKIHLN